MNKPNLILRCGRFSARNYTATTENNIKPVIIPPARKAVIVSTSNDIYTNLALETWIYKHVEFKDNHLLMLWTSDPCVVIGRNQNPWTEANVAGLKAMNVQLARRESGGGTVYHDKGNINISFFTPTDHYNRKYNLQFLADSIKKDCGLKIDISPREDLTLRNFKISGTASKISRVTAYHHCTLLVDAELETLRKSLKPCDWDIKSNATQSTKSKTINLVQEKRTVSLESLIKSIGIYYLLKNNLNTFQESFSEINRLFYRHNPYYFVDKINFNSPALQIVTPCELHFPGFTALRETFAGWKWIYGHTPKFTISKGFKSEQKLTSHDRKPQEAQRIILNQTETYVVIVLLTVENGVVTDVNVKAPVNCQQGVDKKLSQVRSSVGSKFSCETLEFVESVFKEDDDVCVEQVVFNK